MKSIKIVQDFFNKNDAKKAASYQRAKARKLKIKINKVEILNAYEFFKLNGWLKKSPFKTLGTPNPEQFIVIIHYNTNVVPVKENDRLKNKIVKASINKDANKRLFFIRLTKYQKANVQKISSAISNFGFRIKFTRRPKIKPATIPIPAPQYLMAA